MENLTSVTELHISVRYLVEFILRSGDIDDRVGGRDPYAAMQAGSRIHRKIQKSMGAFYHAEVPLLTKVNFPDYDLVIEGRADGVFHKTVEVDGGEETIDVPYGIDEIKGVYLNLRDLDEPIPVHLAQAKCYAFILGLQNDLSTVLVQMTYVNLDSEDQKEFRQEFDFQELREWFYDLVDRYRPWSDFQIEWKKTSMESIQKLNFPYEYREGQKRIVGNVYQTISENKILFMQAPTGSGKTIATIYPSIRAVGEGKAERIFYLTSKTVTKAVALDTYELLEQQGYRGKTVDITAKDRACFLEERKCNPDDCPYAKGHFDRINDAVYDLLTKQDHFRREDILEWAKERMVCPFELGLDVSSWCDNIVCDYNYVFHPTSYLKRFFAEGERSEGIFLIDEAHNLVDRGRSMYSAILIKEDFLKVKKILKGHGNAMIKALDAANKVMLSWKNQMDDAEWLPLTEIDTFVTKLTNVEASIRKFRERKITIQNQDEVTEFYFNVRFFLDMMDHYDDHFKLYCDYGDGKQFRLHLYCMNPSKLLQERLDRSVASTLFSATFLPMHYYKKLLCTEERPYAAEAKSVFTEDQRCVLIGTDVTTRYTSRSKTMYQRYADYLGSMVKSHLGNYMAFFPSYRFMEEVQEAFEETYGDDAIVLSQRPSMDEATRDAFLEEFNENHDKSLIGFCVMGGLFSEGIDLTHDKLIGAAIIGPGLPQVNLEQTILKNYFDHEESTRNQGFQYAYTYPGMAKVLQAAGRVIRTVDDRGVVLLLDERFLWKDYGDVLPSDWGERISCDVTTVEGYLKEFWEV